MSIKSLRNQQSGLVSIIVAITFTIIVSLVSTSFALLSRREARQALDRQLSTQAFYAAESGVNDAVEVIGNAPAGTTVSIDDCNDADSLNVAQGGADLRGGLAYTCVLVDENPTSLEFGPIDTDSSKVIKVEVGGANPISKIRISWQDFGGRNTFAPAGYPYLPQQEFNTNNANSYANNTGILRANIIPVTGDLRRTDLINNSQTLFLYPFESATSGQAGSYGYQTGQGTQGAFVDGKCNTGNAGASGLVQYCNVDITGLSGVGKPNTKVFYISLKGIYRSSKVSVQAYDSDVSTTPEQIVNSQAVIDSTGRANDVLRRIQVRVPILTDYKIPDFALQSADSICKRIIVNAVTVIDGCNSLYVN